MEAPIANSLVLLSEVILSAYPLLIKLVDTSVFFQTGLRMLVFTVMAVLGAVASHQPIAFDTLLTGEGLAVGLLNLLHVLSSYVGFDRLAAGNAMAIFYTYPVFNIFGASMFLGEPFDVQKLPQILLALGGAIMVAQPSVGSLDVLGVVSVLVAALTEVAIYLWFKAHKSGSKEELEAAREGPWRKMYSMYGASGLLWVVAGIIGAVVGITGMSSFKISNGGLAAVLLFNAIVGFGGYALRFFMIPRVTTLVFSALSFFGVVSAYVFGWLGASEVPSFIQIAGALAIVVANIWLVKE